jgi:hypothetical protein
MGSSADTTNGHTTPIVTTVASPTPSLKNSTALAHLPFAAEGTTSPQSTHHHPHHHDRTTSKSGLGYNPPSPRTFMPFFVDRPDCLAFFLERILETRWSSTSTAKLSLQAQEERKATWNTLLELYLMDEQPHPTTSTSPATSPRLNGIALTPREKLKRTKEFKLKALALLKDETVQYDTNQALVLCQLKKFDEGIVYLYEKTEMYTDILRFWMEKQETDRVIEGVRKYG